MGEPVDEGDLERAIVRATLAGDVETARLLADRLRARLTVDCSNVVDISRKRGGK